MNEDRASSLLHRLELEISLGFRPQHSERQGGDVVVFLVLVVRHVEGLKEWINFFEVVQIICGYNILRSQDGQIFLVGGANSSSGLVGFNLFHNTR